MGVIIFVGWRGVFDGVVENMYLYWKYRELVKIIVNEDDFREFEYIVKMLVYESGGVLVVIVKVLKG